MGIIGFIYSHIYQQYNPIKMACPRRLVDSGGFLMAFGEFPLASAGDSVKVDLLNGEMWWAQLFLSIPFHSGVKPAAWFSRELVVMKHVRWWLV